MSRSGDYLSSLGMGLMWLDVAHRPMPRYPLVIPSPTSVLKWRAGDCFDFSITLCSLLLGVVYDAYCVSGFAPRYVTRANTAHLDGWTARPVDTCMSMVENRMPMALNAPVSTFLGCKFSPCRGRAEECFRHLWGL